MARGIGQEKLSVQRHDGAGATTHRVSVHERADIRYGQTQMRWCGAGMRRSARSDSDAYMTVVGWSGCEVGTGSERWSYIQVGVFTIALVCCECEA